MPWTERDDESVDIQPFFRRREEAFEALASAVMPRDVGTRICEHARRLFRCDASVVWPYDEETEQFLPSDLTTDGLDDQLGQMFRPLDWYPTWASSAVLLWPA